MQILITGGAGFIWSHVHGPDQARPGYPDPRVELIRDGVLTGRYRPGDIRHCFADISLARRVLGYEPRVSLSEGLAELGAWLENQVSIDGVGHATEELASRGLTV